jgi:DNA-binding NarL/FixJ family response regulator
MTSHFKVVFDSDGFALHPADLINVNFDVAVLELRLEAQSALDFIRTMFVMAKGQNQSVGRLLITTQFSDHQLRVDAIRAGAVDCVFVSDGIQSLISKIELCADEHTDYAMRELLQSLSPAGLGQKDFQQASVALDTLDEKEAKVLRGFCELKNDSEIASAVHVPKLKVRQSLDKVQRLLLLDTRSQLLLKMFELGALAL